MEEACSTQAAGKLVACCCPLLPWCLLRPLLLPRCRVDKSKEHHSAKPALAANIDSTCWSALLPAHAAMRAFRELDPNNPTPHQ